MVSIAITGGMGAGKSTVLQIVHEFGFDVLDTDQIIHQLYTNNRQVFQAVTKRWGMVVVDNNKINKGKIAEIVFNSAQDLRWLNQLMHPLVKDIITATIQNSNSWLWCAVPLLYEVGWQNLFDYTISLWCTKQIQMQRLQQRGWSDNHIQSRLKRQMNMDDKLKQADFGVINNSSKNLLQEQCKIIINQIKQTINDKND